MTTGKHYLETRAYPFTGIRDTDFDAKVSNAKWLDPYFNNSPNTEQVEHITRGKAYHIYKVEGFGDCADFFLKNDIGEEIRLGNFFFEPVN